MGCLSPVSDPPSTFISSRKLGDCLQGGRSHEGDISIETSSSWSPSSTPIVLLVTTHTQSHPNVVTAISLPLINGRLRGYKEMRERKGRGRGERRQRGGGERRQLLLIALRSRFPTFNSSYSDKDVEMTMAICGRERR